jgi:hypothetical protein
MKNKYHLSGINIIDELLKNSLSAEISDGKGRFYRKMIIRRTSEGSAVVIFRDSDGSRFEFSVRLSDGMASLIRPFLQGSIYEEILLKQLWQCVEKMSGQRIACVRCREP